MINFHLPIDLYFYLFAFLHLFFTVLSSSLTHKRIILLSKTLNISLVYFLLLIHTSINSLPISKPVWMSYEFLCMFYVCMSYAFCVCILCMYVLCILCMSSEPECISFPCPPYHPRPTELRQRVEAIPVDSSDPYVRKVI